MVNPLNEVVHTKDRTIHSPKESSFGMVPEHAHACTDDIEEHNNTLAMLTYGSFSVTSESQSDLHQRNIYEMCGVIYVK